MESKSVAGVMALVVFLTALGTNQVVYSGDVYYCQDTDEICVGVRLSESHKTCYYLVNGTEKGRRCTSLWAPYVMEEEPEMKSVQIFGNNCLHTCEYQDTLGTYTMCYCESGQWAYAGELI